MYYDVYRSRVTLNIRFKAVVFNLVSRFQRGRELFLDGLRADILSTQMYYNYFIRILDGVVGL